MISIISLFLTLCLLLIISKVILIPRNNAQLPGPWGLPLTGNLWQIARRPHLVLFKWAEKYGSLFTIRIANERVVVVNDVQLMRQLFGLPASSANFDNIVLRLVSKGAYGIMSASGKNWAEQRQFLIDNLKTFGFGKSSMEPLILNEVHELQVRIDGQMKASGVVNVRQVFRIAVSNCLWTMVSGQRVSFNNEKIAKLASDIMLGWQKSVQWGVFLLPWLKPFMINPRFAWLVKKAKELRQFIKGVYCDHERSIAKGSFRDLIDCYISKIHETTDVDSSFYGKRGERNALTVIAEMFVAGGGTLAYHVEWVILYICHHPEVQHKMQSEIERVIGNREPTLFDRRNMPYTQVVFLELFRITSVAPFGAVHRLLEDIPFKDYTLPKGALLMTNLYYAHHSKNLWEQPELFRPERFLSEDGSKVEHRGKVIPFQVGLRRCPGEQLVNDVTFLFSVRLLQSYKFLPNPEKGNADFEPEAGFGLFPKPFTVVMKKRNH